MKNFFGKNDNFLGQLLEVGKSTHTHTHYTATVF